jgi:hypothetical protein
MVFQTIRRLAMNGRAKKFGLALTAAALLVAGCGSPPNERAIGAGGGDDPVQSSPDRPDPQDIGTIPPTDECPWAEVSEDDEGGDDAVTHPRCPANDDYSGKPRLVEPRPGMVDLRPVPWAAVEGSPEDTVLRISYWSGVEPCNVLDHVEVEETADTVTVTVFEGHEPGSEDVACIEIAELKVTVVTLESPLGDRTVIDGAEKA